MAKFDDAINHVLGIEGGYANSEYDRGGETKYGISKRRYPTLDIANLTLPQAKKLYKDDFWDCYNLSAINDQTIATYIFDMIVNHGEGIIKTIQRACNKYANEELLAVDGRLGKHTLSVINLNDHNPELFMSIRLERIAYYLQIITNDDKQTRFIKSWLRRALA